MLMKILTTTLIVIAGFVAIGYFNSDARKMLTDLPLLGKVFEEIFKITGTN